MKLSQVLIAMTTCSALVFGALPLAQAQTRATTTGSTQQVGSKSTTEVRYNGKSILKIKRVVAADPLTHQQTSWVEANGLESVIRTLGIDTHWVSGAQQMVLMMPPAWTMSNMSKVAYQNPKRGQFAVIINSVTVGYGPELSVKGTGGSTSVYLPVRFMTNILNGLGIHTTWTPTLWKLSGAVHVAASQPLSGDVQQTFRLELSDNPPMELGLPEPPVPPLPPVTVTLPMNSALKPSTVKFIAVSSYPAEDYVQFGKSEYIVNAPIGSVEQWFAKAYAAQGYQQIGSGSSGNFKTGEHSENFVYAPKVQPDNQQINVTMSYEETKDHQALVEYDVTDVVIPPRPSSSLIRSDVQQVDVTLTTYPQNAGSTTQNVRVTDRAEISAIVTAINGLTQIAPLGRGSSPQAERYSAQLVFTLSDGTSVTVTASKLGDMYLPVVVGKVPLTDSNGTVWAAMLGAMNTSTQP